jgi:hypothetical protein
MTEMNITRAGIDLAKNVLQINSVDDRDMPVLKKQFKACPSVGIFCQHLSAMPDRDGSL